MDRVLINKIMLPALDSLKANANKNGVTQNYRVNNGFQSEFEKQFKSVERTKETVAEIRRPSSNRADKPTPQESSIRQEDAGGGRTVPPSDESADGNRGVSDTTDSSQNGNNIGYKRGEAEEHNDSVNLGEGVESSLSTNVENALEVMVGSRDATTDATTDDAMSDSIGEESGGINPDVLALASGDMADDGALLPSTPLSTTHLPTTHLPTTHLPKTPRPTGPLSAEELKLKQEPRQSNVITKAFLFQGDEVKLKLDGVESINELQSKKSEFFEKLVTQANSENSIILQNEGKHKSTGIDPKSMTKLDSITNNLVFGEVKSEEGKKAATQPPLSTQLHTPLGKPNWDVAFNQRILWMVKGHIKAADIQIYPPELGPIKVKVQVNNDQVQVSFVAQGGLAKEALEQSLPKLREMFEQEGMDLVEANVNDNSQGANDDADEEEAMLARGENDDLVGEANKVEDNILLAETAVNPNIVDQYV